jgi:RimJ/RimL family protein N-acetyltransferase
MEAHTHIINDEISLLIREATVEDAPAIINYLNEVSGESDFLAFGPGEFGISEGEERNILRQYHDSGNQLCLVGVIDDHIVSVITFTAGQRPRTRHSGEFGMSVSQSHWGLGIGTLLVDGLISWAKATDILQKINLRVRTDNHRAIILYEKRGFKIEGTMRKELFVDGEYFDYHWMGLEL